MDFQSIPWAGDDATFENALLQAGFSDSKRARRLFVALATSYAERAALQPIASALLTEMADSADPMRALLNLSHLRDTYGDGRELWNCLGSNAKLLERTCRLLAFSQAVAETLVREPQLLSEMVSAPTTKSRPQMRREAFAIVDSGSEVTSRTMGIAALRAYRRRETLRIALLDMERATWRDSAAFELVVHEISDLAAVCVAAALRLVAPLDAPFAVLAMGKMGARELNYSSDIDLIFIHDGDSQSITAMATELVKILGETSPQGTLYRVDMRLRPDGKSGALVTSIGYALSYYESFAAPWEWQATIKCRAVAGDARLARRFRRFVRSITWARRPDDSHLREMLAMKKRMEATVEGKDAENVKQGPGSIRDAEWVVQQLQMMVGPAHPRCRNKATLLALDVLQQFDALTAEQARELRQGYLFLRVVEHRLQLLDERAVRSLPRDAAERVALARRLGCPARGAAAVRWLEEEIRHHQARIRHTTHHLFWGFSAASENEVDFAEEFGMPSAQRLERIAAGTAIQPYPAPLARQNRAALSVLTDSLQATANPERAIQNLEHLCDASGNRLSLLRSLGSAPALARAVLAILGGSSRLSDTIVRFPELLDMAAQRALLDKPRPFSQALTDCRDYCFSFSDKTAALRRWKARELLRIGLRDLALDAPAPEITAEIAALAQSCLTVACDEIGKRRRPHSESVAFAVLGMGKLGGGEMHYNSDADVIFCYDDFAGRDDIEKRGAAAGQAAGWAGDFMKLLGERTEEGVCFEVDARLRPDGRSGPLVRTVNGYIEYFERPSEGLAVWERQALTRARTIAGDAATAARLRAAIGHVAFPDRWDAAWGDELRHIKARIEKERSARGAAGGIVYDVKLGPGCLNDIEFCAQWLALKYGHAQPALQTPNTLRQIEAVRQAELLSEVQVSTLAQAYTFLRRAELRLQVTQEHSVQAVKRDSTEWTTWARSLYPATPDAPAHFAAQWQAHTLAAREIMEAVRDAL